MKVLVADDEVGVRVMVSRILTKEFGVDVIEADDGIAALGCLLAQPIDFLLMDISMPMMSGLEALEAIRASRDHATLPVAIMTGQPGERDFKRAQDLGIAGFIVKPFSILDFRNRMAPIIRAFQEREVARVRTPGRLALDPSHRVLLVDQSPEFLAIAEDTLSRVCRVEVARNEFAAIKACLEAPPDVLLVGTTSDLSSTEAMGRKVRSLTERGPLQIVAAVTSAELPRLRELGLFDATVVRSFAAQAFEASLRPVLDDEARARLIFHPASPWLAEALEVSARRIGERAALPVTSHTHRPALETAVRWVSSEVELQGGRFAWGIRLRCPFEVALEMSEAGGGSRTDAVSESDALKSVAALAASLAAEWCARATAQGLSCHANAPTTVMLGCLGAGSDSDVPLRAQRWLSSGRREVAILEAVPLVTASARHGR